MRGEEWRLPGGRRSCGSTELRPWEKIEDWWGERVWRVLFVWPQVVPFFFRALAVCSSGSLVVVHEILADSRSSLRSWQTRSRPPSLPAPARKGTRLHQGVAPRRRREKKQRLKRNLLVH